jgi:hypothetical protein
MIYTIVVLITLGGWIANLVKFFYMLDGAVTAMFIARLVGVFVAPLGSLLGYF